MILIGVDSGGSRSSVLIAAGPETYGYESRSSLSGILAPSEYAHTLRKILLPAKNHLRGIDTTGDISIFISAAGFTSATRDDFADAVDLVAPSFLPRRVVTIGIANDAASLILGHSAHAIAIAGTGSSVVVRANDGRLHQTGGHEWVASGYGSGFWIGIRAIRRVYRDHESANDTYLFECFMREYGIRPGDKQALFAKLRSLAIADSNMKREIARFAKSVCAAAESGSADAQAIVRSEAEELADVLADSMRRHIASEELMGAISIVECGGLLGNDFYSHIFRARVESQLRSGGREPMIEWLHVATGADSALGLARSIADTEEDLTIVDVAHRPLIARFD